MIHDGPSDDRYVNERKGDGDCLESILILSRLFTAAIHHAACIKDPPRIMSAAAA